MKNSATKPATAKPAMKFDIYEAITEELCKMLETGVCPWRRPWKAIGGIPRNYKGRAYRGANAVLMALACMANGWEHPIFLTFKQVQACGGKVIKGSKSNIVLFATKLVPKKYKGREHECPASEKKFMMRYYRVFNVAQCEGITLPQTEGNDNALIGSCADLVDCMPLCPEIIHGGDKACYRPATDKVNMPRMEAFDSSEAYYSTLFHELTHSTGHATRLDRKDAFTDGFGSDPYAFEELVAELGASFLCGHADIYQTTKEESASYLNNWLSKLKGDKKFFFRAAAQAQKACDYILGNVKIEAEA